MLNTAVTYRAGGVSLKQRALYTCSPTQGLLVLLASFSYPYTLGGGLKYLDAPHAVSGRVFIQMLAGNAAVLQESTMLFERKQNYCVNCIFKEQDKS